MSKPFKFRHVNEIAGGFAAIVVIVLVVGIVLAARAQKWFEKVTTLWVVMPAEGCLGLKSGAEVQMLGTVVGTIDHINPPDEETGRMRARIHIDPHFAQFIRAGLGDRSTASRAIIHVPIAIDDPFLEITRGEGPPLPPAEDLVADPEAGATDAINKTLADIRSHTLPAAEGLLKEYTKLAADLRDPHSPLQQTLARIDAVTARLERNDNALGRLLNDKQLADDLSQTLSKLNATADSAQLALADLQKTVAEFPKIAASASSQIDKLPAMVDQTRQMMLEVQRALQDLQKTTAQLPAVVGSVKQTVDALPDVLAHVQQTLVEVQKLIKGMQELPFIRDNVERSAQGNTTLRPADIGGPQ